MLAACMLSHVFCVLGVCLIHKQTEALVSCVGEQFRTHYFSGFLNPFCTYFFSRHTHTHDKLNQNCIPARP